MTTEEKADLLPLLSELKSLDLDKVLSKFFNVKFENDNEELQNTLNEMSLLVKKSAELIEEKSDLTEQALQGMRAALDLFNMKLKMEPQPLTRLPDFAIIRNNPTRMNDGTWCFVVEFGWQVSQFGIPGIEGMSPKCIDGIWYWVFNGTNNDEFFDDDGNPITEEELTALEDARIDEAIQEAKQAFQDGLIHPMTVDEIMDEATRKLVLASIDEIRGAIK